MRSDLKSLVEVMELFLRFKSKVNEVLINTIGLFSLFNLTDPDFVSCERGIFYSGVKKKPEPNSCSARAVCPHLVSAWLQVFVRFDFVI